VRHHRRVHQYKDYEPANDHCCQNSYHSVAFSRSAVVRWLERRRRRMVSMHRIVV
jgi:hypothetical protein